jgi:hypothetical protein
MEGLNAVIFHQLEDNIPCEGMCEEVVTGSLKKPDPSCGGH